MTYYNSIEMGQKKMHIEKKSKIYNLLLGTQNIKMIIPGFLLSTGVLGLSYLLNHIFNELLSFGNKLFSPLLIAVLLGIIIRNFVSLPETFKTGISFGMKKLLKAGIVLMGIRLSVFSVLRIGSMAFGMVAVCICAAIAVTIMLARKIKIRQELGLLISAGTSICGVSAILALTPAIDAEEEEVAYSIGVITLFGIMATIFYPYLVESLLNLNIVQAGFFIGTSVHDTSQVTATSLIYDQLWANKTSSGLTCADIAITIKLLRNTFMLGVIPVLSYLFNNKKTLNKKSSKYPRIYRFLSWDIF
jgi:uncharacterized integral membrane protein (TIGR00698 family)